MKIRNILKICKDSNISTKRFFEVNNFSYIDTFNGKYKVNYIDSDCWIHCYNNVSFCCHYDTNIEILKEDGLK